MSERLGTVVFAHDHEFFRDQDGSWFSRSGQFGERLWARYLEHVARVVVVARERPLATHETLEQLERVSGPEVVVQSAPSLASLRGQIFGLPVARRILREALRSADLLIARLPSQLGLVASEIASELGKPWCVECVGCTWDAHRNHGKALAPLYAPRAYLEMRAAVARAPLVSYVSETFLQKRYPTWGIGVACSDVEIDDYGDDTLSRRIARIDERERTGRVLRFGLIGSLGHRYKGVDVALAALAAAADNLPPFELRVLGAGDPAPWAELAAQRGLARAFRPCGALPGGRPVRDWLDRIDIYLQPSRQEGLPRALIEAMARACPALGSAAGGIPELLAPSCLHDVGDAGQLAEQIRLAAAPGWQREQARRNHAHAAQYLPSVLQARREHFWQHARQLVEARR